MNLPKKAIEEFMKLWREQTGEDISFELASRQAALFLQGVRAVFDDQKSRDGP